MKQKKIPNNYLFIHVVVIVFALFVTIGTFCAEIVREKEYQIHKNAVFIVVDATITEYREFKTNDESYYAIFFEYVSPKGETYRGLWCNDVYMEEEAKSMIYSRVQVYYSSDIGVCKTTQEIENMRKYPKPNHIPGVVVIVVCFAIFFNSLVRFIIYGLRRRSKTDY